MGISCKLSFATTLALLFLASDSALGSNPSHQFNVGVRKIREEVVVEQVMTQPRPGGPGSSPPTCRSKCGRCAPCRAVHVPIQPGFIMPLEYYPEAWRCKCGTNLFVP